jgi:hypothetical protein
LREVQVPLRIENAIDLHCHFGPDVVGGPHEPQVGVNALDAAREARDSGHRAIVLKSHSFPSVQLAQTLQAAAPEIRVFGGACTDLPTGGLNVEAVEAALRMGAKIVWLPTVHSHQDWLNGMGPAVGSKDEGIRVVDETGEPVPAVKAIVDLVRQHDAILATGHVTAAEHYAVVKAFARQGKVLVTHAGEHLAGPHLTPEQCRELAELGATIELTALTCAHVFGQRGKSPGEMAKMIRTVGCAHCTLASDYGWSRDMSRPAVALKDFTEQLWREGLSEAELAQMSAARPAELLGL